MSNYTPGPWIIDELAEAQEPGFYGAPGDPNGYHAVGAGVWRVTGFMGDANAKLIAAAPELLEALAELADWLAYGLNKAAGAEPTAEDHTTCARVAAKARAAVDKATK